MDKYLLSKNIMQGNWHIENSILPTASSDHWPINIKISFSTDKEVKPFRFEFFWLTHPNFATKIKEWWEESSIITGSTMMRFQQRLKLIKAHLKKWNKEEFSNIHHEKKNLERQMACIQQDMILNGHTERLVEEEKTTQMQLDD